MARSVYMCGEQSLTLAECDPCDALESRVAQLEECCTEAKDSLSDHEERITQNTSDIAGKQNALTAGENITIEDDVISADGLVDQETFNRDMQTVADVGNSNCERLSTLEQCCESVNNKFGDYYTKSETYTQTQIQNLLADLDGIHFEITDTLPATGDGNVIYVLTSDNNSMWVYTNNDWVHIGDTSIDLSQYLKTSDAINMIHPVGDTVIRLDNTDPSTLYSGTTWQKVSEGKMLLGADANHPLGSTGGVETNTVNISGIVGNTTLTAAQSGIQEHTHGFTQPTVSGGAVTNGITGGSHNHLSAGYKTAKFQTGGGTNYRWGPFDEQASGLDGKFYTATTTHTHNLPAHNHSVSGGAVGAVTGGAKNATASHTHSFTGTQVNLNNMPPHLAVNIWVRTA